MSQSHRDMGGNVKLLPATVAFAVVFAVILSEAKNPRISEGTEATRGTNNIFTDTPDRTENGDTPWPSWNA